MATNILTAVHLQESFGQSSAATGLRGDATFCHIDSRRNAQEAALAKVAGKQWMLEWEGRLPIQHSIGLVEHEHHASRSNLVEVADVWEQVAVDAHHEQCKGGEKILDAIGVIGFATWISHRTQAKTCS